MESMARDLRHPYIPSTTVLGDNQLLLIISVPPPSVMLRSDDVILVGEDVVVYCDVDLMRGSDVTVDVSWFQDSVPVRTDSRVSISGVTGDEDGGHSSLSFSPLHSSDMATYECHVTLTPLLGPAIPVSSNASLFLSPSECAPVYYNYLLIYVRPSETGRHHIHGCQVRQCHHPVDSSLHILLSRDIRSTVWH